TGLQLLPDQLVCIFSRRRAVCRAELLGLLPLVGQGVDRDHVLRTGVPSALNGVDADASDAVDDHRLTRLYAGGVDGRPPAGWYAATDQHGDLQRQVVVALPP